MSTRTPGGPSARRARRGSPRKTPVQERARGTVEHVLEAAAQVCERGFASGTTNRIAERAGVSIGTVYQYFPNKQALAVALAERHVGEMMGRLAAWEGEAAQGSAGLREVLRRLAETSSPRTSAGPGCTTCCSRRRRSLRGCTTR